MFVNHTLDNIFDDFKRKYIQCIYAHYHHVCNVSIHCLYTEQYLQLKNVPSFDTLDNDPFAFACIRNEETNLVEAYIIYSPSICNVLMLNEDELNAAIAHEVGHIVHYFNEALHGLPQICQEIKADEIVSLLDLKESLISTLYKLINSKRFTESQCNDLIKRIMFLRAQNQPPKGMM